MACREDQRVAGVKRSFDNAWGQSRRDYDCQPASPGHGAKRLCNSDTSLEPELSDGITATSEHLPPLWFEGSVHTRAGKSLLANGTFDYTSSDFDYKSSTFDYTSNYFDRPGENSDQCLYETMDVESGSMISRWDQHTEFPAMDSSYPLSPMECLLFGDQHYAEPASNTTTQISSPKQTESVQSEVHGSSITTAISCDTKEPQFNTCFGTVCVITSLHEEQHVLIK